MKGQPGVSIYIRSQADDSISTAIKTLSEELKKAGIDKISIHNASSYTNSGILLLHTPSAEAGKISFPVKLKSFGPEGIYIKGDNQSLIILGNSKLALQEAVFIYLEHLGFSYLLPGEHWQNVPKLTSLYKPVSILTKPDYEYRWIANGHGYFNSAKIEKEFNFWAGANRMGGAFQVNAGHIYDDIMQRNEEVFKQHPEYFAQPGLSKGTLPAGPKFNVANQNLVKLIADDAISRIEFKKRMGENVLMISMEPSDGPGFCNTPDCNAIGTPSDQVYYLSNKVAKELQKKYPGIWVGNLAYSEHILPTKYKLEPNIFVMITNGFNRTKYSTQELMELWNKKATKVGIYEYLSVYEWDNDMPGQVSAAKTKFIKKSIVQYYKSGARAYLGESTIGWISRGPGQYFVSKLLWNTNLNIDSLKKDFYKKAFGDVSELMMKLYNSWEYYPHRVPAENDLADWLYIVNEAYNKSGSAIIKKRIDEIKRYMHYLVLYKNLKKKPSEENLNKALSFAYRNFENPSFATLPVMVSLANYSGFTGKGIYDNPNQVWKNNKMTYTDAELQKDFKQDIADIKKVEGVTSFSHSNTFSPIDPLLIMPGRTYTKTPHALWGKTEYVFYLSKKSDKNYIELSSGFAANPPVDRSVTIEVYSAASKANSVEEEKPLMVFNQSIKTKTEKFGLINLPPGYYKLRVSDQQKMFILNFSQGIKYSLVLTPYDKLVTTTVAGYNIFYFLVPRGVKKFLCTKTVTLQLKSPSGRIIDKQNGADESFYVDVLPGEEGIWTIEKQSGSIYLEGVPPYLGDSPSEMLISSYTGKFIKQ